MAAQVVIDLDSDEKHQPDGADTIQSDRPAVLQTGMQAHPVNGVKPEAGDNHAAQNDKVPMPSGVCQEAELKGTSAAANQDTEQQKAEVQVTGLSSIQTSAGISGIQTNAAPVRRFKGVPYIPDSNSIAFLTNMGFGNDQAVRALKVTQGNIERAANWLLSGL